VPQAEAGRPFAEAVEQGASLPELARLLARALDASLLVLDRAGLTVAVAARSPAEERALRAAGDGVVSEPLLHAGERVGTVRLLGRAADLPPLWPLLRALLAGELRRLALPGRAARRAAQRLIDALFAAGESGALAASLGELGLDPAEGATVVFVRIHHQGSVGEGWGERALTLFEQALRGGGAAVAGAREGDERELVGVVCGGDEAAQRAAAAAARELSGLAGRCVVGYSRSVRSAQELPRAAAEALLAANVAEGEEVAEPLGFEQTGSYRLLLPAVRENEEELRRFYEETVAPLLAYDEQYQTALVETLQTYLDCDGSVAVAAQRLFTHRHTVYYRLERIKELSGLDVASSEGRERLSLGLKAMRVLGLAPRRAGGGELRR